MGRTTRDWATDIGLFLFASAFSVITADSLLRESGLSPAEQAVEQIVGALGCAALFLRRRWPVQLAVVLLVAGTFSRLVTGPSMVAMFTVAARCSPRTTAWVAALVLARLPMLIIRGRPDPPGLGPAIAYLALIAGAIGWGLAVRSQRQLIASLRDRADRAAAEAQRQAREDIAREMHDVLAHRLSLLSVHAGALEFNPGAPAAEIRRAAEVIRDSAHQALEDLREVIGVLRAAGTAGPAAPVLTDLGRLVDESRAAGMRVTLDHRVEGPATALTVVGRTAYRVVQEGLTNARKHAPETAVAVTVSGGPDDGLTVEVRNAVTGRPSGDSATIPGAGQGLIGLAERTRLVGGRLEYGPVGTDFLLRAWLPWPAQRDRPEAAEATPVREVPEPAKPPGPA